MHRLARTGRRAGRQLAAGTLVALALGAAPPATPGAPGKSGAPPASGPAAGPATKAAASAGPASRPVPAPRPAPAAEGLPTQADIQAAFDAKDYPAALQKLTRVLTLKGKAADPYDRHALLVLKGETHLRLKAGSAAAQAFAEAAKIAPDGAATAADIAAEMLVRRSGAGLAYQPRLKDPSDKTKALPPIDVVEPESRTKAVAALYADEWAVVEPRVKALGPIRTLDPLLALLPAARNARWLELAATGKDDRSKALLAPVAERAKAVFASTLKELAESVDPIEVAALQISPARVPQYDPQTGRLIRFIVKYRRTGPSPRGFTRLREVFKTTTQIRDTCDELGGSLGASGHEFDEVKAKADQLRLKAGTLLDTDWTVKYDQPPSVPKPAGS